MVAKIAFLFPGQGSQYIGMGKNCLMTSTEGRRLFEQADSILGMPLTQVMMEGPEEKLRETSITQPALFLASAVALEWIKERGIKASWAAGHSLGEYSALYAAGVLSFENTLKLVAERGKAMQEAGAANPGTMAAILGLAPEKVVEICESVAAECGVCSAANFNAAGQTVIAGQRDCVTKAMDACHKAGAVKVVALNVSGAFHSALMESAVVKMKPLIEATSFSPANIPVVTNVDAQATTAPTDFKRKLIEQINHSVKWDQSLKTMLELGADTFIEVGSGKVLSTMIKKLDRQKNVLWTDDLESIEKSLSTMSAQA